MLRALYLRRSRVVEYIGRIVIESIVSEIMRGYQHFLFSFLLSLSFFYPLDIEEVVFSLFVGLGSLIPDVDAKESSIKRGRMSFLGRFNVVLSFLSLLVKPFGFLFRKHRGCFHSLFGALLFFLFSYFIFSLLSYERLSFALFVGFLLHLIEDSLTPTGVKWFCGGFVLRGKLKHLFLVDVLLLVSIFLFVYNPFWVKFFIVFSFLFLWLFGF